MTQRPLIIAHRGASASASENTLPAVMLAFMQGADGVEIDIRMTSDGHLVAIHDEDTKRVSGVTLRVARTPLDKLRLLDVGRVKTRRGQGQRMPTLEEVLDILPSQKLLYLDLKTGVEGVEPLVAALKKRSCDFQERVKVVSNQVETLVEVRQALPDCGVVLQCDRRWTEKTDRWIPEADMVVTVAKTVGADEVLVDARSLIADVEMLEELSRHGVRTQVGTVNRAPSARRMANLGVSAIMTDYPGHLVSSFQRGEVRSRLLI